MKAHQSLLAVAFLVLPVGVASAKPLAPQPRLPEPAFVEPAGSGVSDWIVNSADNICGLRDPRQLSNPAKVSYEKLHKATPEIRKMTREGIDPESAEGIQLNQQAVDRVTKACKAVMTERGNCSVWKKIRHKDGRAITDLTTSVLPRL